MTERIRTRQPHAAPDRRRGPGREASRAARPVRTTARWLRPPVLHPVAFGRDLPALLALVLALVALYARTTPRVVLLEDDGLFLMSAATLGVSHPPGYPVHTLLGWLAVQVPFGTPAFRVHLLSGVLGALACGALAWIVRRRTGIQAAAAVAALAYGVSEHFWSQAIIAEVYTLNALCVFAALALCQEAAARPARRLLLALAAVYGLSLANHWPLTVLATPALALTLLPRWREILPKIFLLACTAMACAALPYAWMVWRSHQDPLVAFYGPIASWREVVFYVSRQGYAGVEASGVADWTDKLRFAGYVARETGVALTAVGTALAALGVARQWRNASRVPLLGEIAACLASGVVLALILGFEYDFLRVAVFRPYPLVAYGLVAIWMGVGLAWALEQAGSRTPRLRHALACAAFALPVLAAWQHWPVNDRARDDFADRHGRLVLDLVEPDATVLVHGDADTGPLGYLHLVEHVRPDVTIHNVQGLVFRDRVVPALAGPRAREAHLRAYLERLDRPAYHMTERLIPSVHGEEHLGLVRRIVPGEPPGILRPRFDPRAADYVRELMATAPARDRWVRLTRNQIVHRYAGFLGLATIADDDHLRAQVQPLVTLAERNYYGLTGMVEILAEQGTTREAWTRADRYLDAAARLRDDSVDDERLGREHYLAGFVAFRLGDHARAAQLFRRSLEAHPRAGNASHAALAQLAPVKPAVPIDLTLPTRKLPRLRGPGPERGAQVESGLALLASIETDTARNDN